MLESTKRNPTSFESIKNTTPANRRTVPRSSYNARVGRTGVALLIIPLGFLSQGSFAVGIDELMLSPTETAARCQVIGGAHPVRNDAQVFYDHGVYSEMLPLMLNKRWESFQCGKEKGTLYFFEYATTAQRENAEMFARTTLWGGDAKASPAHPEQIFHWDRFLMVLSFKGFQRELLESLLNKFKRLDAGSPSP